MTYDFWSFSNTYTVQFRMWFAICDWAALLLFFPACHLIHQKNVVGSFIAIIVWTVPQHMIREKYKVSKFTKVHTINKRWAALVSSINKYDFQLCRVILFFFSFVYASCLVSRCFSRLFIWEMVTGLNVFASSTYAVSLLVHCEDTICCMLKVVYRSICESVSLNFTYLGSFTSLSVCIIGLILVVRI